MQVVFLRRTCCSNDREQKTNEVEWNYDIYSKLWWKYGSCFYKLLHSSFPLRRFLGGGIARVKDASVRARMQDLQSAWPVRSTYQRLWTVLRAFAFKAFLMPCLYGLLEALCTKVGLSFDYLIVAGVRGFAKLEYVRQQPSVPLLETLLWRLQSQHMASFDDSTLQSSVAKRRRLARVVTERLSEEGLEFVTQGDGTNAWWLLPMLSDEPKQMVDALITHGFDATNTSTQLRQVAAAATCKSAALRASDGKDNAFEVDYICTEPPAGWKLRTLCRR